MSPTFKSEKELNVRLGGWSVYFHPVANLYFLPSLARRVLSVPLMYDFRESTNAQNQYDLTMLMKFLVICLRIKPDISTSAPDRHPPVDSYRGEQSNFAPRSGYFLGTVLEAQHFVLLDGTYVWLRTKDVPRRAKA